MAKSTTHPPKGTRDFLPGDIRRREHVTSTIRRIYEAYGFEPLESPTLERLDTLLGKYGEEGDQLLFKVLLRGQPLVSGIREAATHLQAPGGIVHGRSGETAPGAERMLADMGLRYDLTVPLARVYAAHQAKLPSVFKRYQIQPVWRADTPGKGRYREFYQCDVDVVGATSPVVEVEVAAAVCECMEALGFDDFVVRLNHRGLLRALMECVGVPASHEADALVALDKLEKVGLEGVAEELAQRGIEPAARGRLLELVGGDGLSLEKVEPSLRDHAQGTAAVANLRTVLELAQATAAGRRLQLDLSLVRGLGYYTGCIFEIAVADLAGSLGGGGRYDGLIGMFSGRDVPACGFSLGLERILVVMEQRGMFPEALQPLDAVVAATRPEQLAQALALSSRLREPGRRVELRPQPDKPVKVRKHAEQRGARWAVWLQDDGLSAWNRSNDQFHHQLSEPQLHALLSPGSPDSAS